MNGTKSYSEDKVREVGKLLNNPERPLKERFRALFTLKNIGGPIAIDEISKCFDDPSALLQHELAYCLGQMADVAAIPTLSRLLEDKKRDPIVRHEAGEALGAIGDSSSIQLLEKYSSDESQRVAETCQIAAQRIRWQMNPDLNPESRYNSIDPAPPGMKLKNSLSDDEILKLKQTLLDPKLSLWERYRAMFSLRDEGSKSSILAIAEGLKCEESALFRHEIAFVLGQIQSDACIEQLEDCLSDIKESPMVRHECAEALGSIATEQCEAILKRFLKDPEAVVRESCEVALDICDYENSAELQFLNA